MLQRLLGTSFSTVRYHVSSLERDGEVLIRRDHRYQRLYPRGTSDAMQAVYAVLHRGTTRRVLQAIADRDAQSLTIADLASKVRLSTSAVAECVKQLGIAGLVTRSHATDGRVRCEVRDRELVLELLAAFRRNALDIAADNLIDLWDFESSGL